MHCSDCDMIMLTQSMTTKNNIAACQNEAVAFAEFVTGLVDDFGTGIVSRDDMMALLNKYAAFDSPIGKFFFFFCFSFLLFCLFYTFGCLQYFSEYVTINHLQCYLTKRLNMHEIT